MAGALGAVVLLALAWFLVPFAFRKWEERRLRARCRAMKAIVLTYDDGPGTMLTDCLLALLARHGVRANFFVLGRNAEMRPEIVRRLVAEGHEVGSHTQEHSNAWKTDPFTAARDLARGIRTASALGADARLFRPPFRKLTLAGPAVAERIIEFARAGGCRLISFGDLAEMTAAQRRAA